MPAYEICYIDDHGKLERAFSVKFDSDLHARILAHAMKPAACHQFEVWEGDRLIYSRPEQGWALDVSHAKRQTPPPWRWKHPMPC